MTRSIEDLNVGDAALVHGFEGDREYTERLMRLGLIPGTAIILKRRAPLGDPVEIRFRGYSLVLRPAEARCLQLEPA